jgi:hypothetical protein
MQPITLFLPCEFSPDFRRWKQKVHKSAAGVTAFSNVWLTNDFDLSRIFFGQFPEWELAETVQIRLILHHKKET